MFYNYPTIDGYNCPIKIIVSQRGLGKTFGKVKKCVENFITKKERFIYVVETGDMAKELSKNDGEKFFSSLLKYYSEKDTSRKRYFYNKLVEMKIESTEEGYTGKSIIKAKLIGSTIKINQETAGYILDMNSFGEIKRNNFVGVKTVVIDEFISEKLDKTSLQNPKKIASIIQSVARLNDIKIYLLGNSVRKDDSILARLGFKIDGYGFYKKYDEFGLVAVLHFVDPSEYGDFSDKSKKSVAGRFASMLKETNEEENKFLDDVPKDKRLNSFEYRKNGLSLNITRGGEVISIRELKDGNFACVPFNGKNVSNLYCLNPNEQGYKFGYHILCNQALKQTLLNLIRSEKLYYYSDVEYAKLKLIIKGD